MAKGEFKIKNINNFAASEIIGQNIEFKYKNNKPIPLGIVSDVDKDYVYIKFEHNNDEDLTVELSKDITWSMDVRGD